MWRRYVTPKKLAHVQWVIYWNPVTPDLGHCYRKSKISHFSIPLTAICRTRLMKHLGCCLKSRHKVALLFLLALKSNWMKKISHKPLQSRSVLYQKDELTAAENLGKANALLRNSWSVMRTRGRAKCYAEEIGRSSRTIDGYGVGMSHLGSAAKHCSLTHFN